MPGPASLLQVLEKPSTWSLKTQDVGGGSVRSGAAGAIYFQVSGVIREAINYIALKKKKITDIRKWKNNEDENLWEGEGPTAGESDGAVSPPPPGPIVQKA